MEHNRQAEMGDCFVRSVQPIPDEIWFSVDIGMGASTICKWSGVGIEYVVRISTLSLKQSTELVINIIEKDRNVLIAVDTIGVGAGVYDYLLDKGYTVKAVNHLHIPSKTPHTIG